MANDDVRPQSPSRGFAPTGAGAVAGALALLALIALASTSRVGSGGTLDIPGPAFVGSAVVAVAAGIAIGAAVLSIGGYTLLGETRVRTKLLLLAGGVVLATAFVALLLYGRAGANRPEYVTWCQDGTVHMRRYQWAVDRRWGDRGYGGKVIDTGRPCRAAGGGSLNVVNRRGGGGDARLLLAAVVGATLSVLLVGALVAAVAMRRRRGVRAAGTEEDAVLHALEESLDDLRRERDVRRAIIACYARMERALARLGRPRRPHEAPMEYLARVLAWVTGGGGAAGALTELFERAKFSVEPMGEHEKEQAIAALEQLRAEASA